MVKHRTKHRRLAALLAAVLLTGLLPVTAGAADSGNKAMMLGVDGIQGGGANSYVWFGNYGQNNGTNDLPDGQENVDYITLENPQNGKEKYWPMEPIQWRVLAGPNDDTPYTYKDWDGNEKSGLFLLSENNLDVYWFNKNQSDGNQWPTSDVRDWLNLTEENPTGFYNVAFNGKEKSAVGETLVKTDSVDDSKDYVFLLSVADAQNEEYGFTDDAARQAKNTGYVRGGGKTEYDGMYVVGKADYWWLRSPGLGDNYAAYVNTYGGVYTTGYNVDGGNIAVRPAFHLDLNSVLFTSAADSSDPKASGALTAVGDYSGKTC